MSTDHNLHLPSDPIDGFLAWLKEAEDAKVPEPVAMTLATVSSDGRPSARIVYYKGLSSDSTGRRCPRFFTNFESRKSKEIAADPNVALVFHWTTLSKQLRIEGVCEKLTTAESETYFQSRARGSRIGAWASPQSHEIPSRDFLENRVKEIETKFSGKEIPCPPFWGGWRVVPTRIEFWHGGESRLHDRQVFEWTGTAWRTVRLAP